MACRLSIDYFVTLVSLDSFSALLRVLQTPSTKYNAAGGTHNTAYLPIVWIKGLLHMYCMQSCKSHHDFYTIRQICVCGCLVPCECQLIVEFWPILSYFFRITRAGLHCIVPLAMAMFLLLETWLPCIGYIPILQTRYETLHWYDGMLNVLDWIIENTACIECIWICSPSWFWWRPGHLHLYQYTDMCRSNILP